MPKHLIDSQLVSARWLRFRRLEKPFGDSVGTFARIVVWNGPTLTPNHGIQHHHREVCLVSCLQNQDCLGCSGFLEEIVTAIDINKIAFLLGKTPADCAKSPYPSKFPPSLIHATGIKLSKRDI